MVPGDDVDYIETHKKIFKHIYDYDFIIPNYVKIKNKSKLRLFISTIFTFIINFLSGNKIGYYNGTCAFRTNIKNIKNLNNGFGFQAQIICSLFQKVINLCNLIVKLCTENSLRQLIKKIFFIVYSYSSKFF